MEESGAPGSEHKLLAKHVGSWKTDGKMWMAPGAPPTVTTDEAVVRLILGGGYMTGEYNAEMPPCGSFSGRGLTAFDRGECEFGSTCCYSMSDPL